MNPTSSSRFACVASRRASHRPAGSAARYDQVFGARATNSATRRRPRYQPGTAAAFGRMRARTVASASGGGRHCPPRPVPRESKDGQRLARSQQPARHSSTAWRGMVSANCGWRADAPHWTSSRTPRGKSSVMSVISCLRYFATAARATEARPTFMGSEALPIGRPRDAGSRRVPTLRTAATQALVLRSGADAASLLRHCLSRRDVEHRAIFEANPINLAQHVAGEAEFDDRDGLEGRRNPVGEDLVELH